jgi:DNA replication protein DnaC
MTTNTEQRTCERHGPYEAVQLWRGAGNYSSCPQCQAEEDRRCALARKAAEDRDARRTCLADSGLHGRFAEATFANFEADTPEMRKALTACRSYAEEFGPGSGTLWLVGPPGGGKTHLGSAIVREVIERHVLSARITTPRKMIRRLRATWQKGTEESEADAIRDLASYSLLVLDEVGVSLGTDAELVQLYDVLDARYALRNPTLVISNLTPQLVKGFLGDRLFDRLRERAQVLACDWPSYRGKVAP